MGRYTTLTNTYKIYDDNTIEMWVSGQSQEEPPVLRQPFNPKTQEPWLSREEAETWILEYIGQPVAEETPEPVVE